MPWAWLTADGRMGGRMGGRTGGRVQAFPPHSGVTACEC